MELLKIVRAEESAEQQVAEALRKKEESIARALQQRENKLAGVNAPAQKTVSLKTTPPDLDGLKKKAHKNMDAAVKKILEEVYATT